MHITQYIWFKLLQNQVCTHGTLQVLRVDREGSYDVPLSLLRRCMRLPRLNLVTSCPSCPSDELPGGERGGTAVEFSPRGAGLRT